ncbi:MAG: hypothetical protein ACX939_03305 [Hyphococcus sp.]
MAAYAPNPKSSSQSGYASLTAGLLARKGEAMPAVDADAHEGVDIDMRPMAPARGPGENVSQQTITTLYPPNPKTEEFDVERLQARIVNGHATAAPEKMEKTAEPAPEVWTLTAPRKPGMGRRPQPRPSAEPGDRLQRRATVTFRMPAKDFIRMRLAARDMEMSCQAMLLEALDCYLDANDIPPVTQEMFEQEVERLAQAAHRRRAAKASAVAE